MRGYLNKTVFILWTETNRLLAEESAGSAIQKYSTATKLHSHIQCVADVKQRAYLVTVQ